MDNSTEENLIPIQQLTSKYRHFIFIISAGVLCLFVNLCALCAVTKANGSRPNYSLINLYISSFPPVVVALLNGLNEIDVIQLRGEWLCGIWSSFRRFSITILPVTVVAMSLERLSPRQHKSSPKIGFSCPIKVFVGTWTLASLVSLPSLFQYQYIKACPNNYCKKVLLLGSPWARLAYEGTHFIFFHVSPSVYFIYDFYRLKFKLDYLFFFKKVPLGLEEKVRRLRLVFFYSVSFIGVWIPFGLMAFTRKVFEDPENPVLESESPVINVLGVLVMTHLACHPVFYFYTHHRMSLVNLINISGIWNRLCQSTEPKQGSEQAISSSLMRMETYNETKGNIRIETIIV